MRSSPVVIGGAPLQAWNSAHQLNTVAPISLGRLVPKGARVVVVAPHPGDEVLSCGGLLQLLNALGHPLQLISITDGSGSHPGSDLWPEQRLSAIRPQESAEALRRLGLPLHSLKWIRGGFKDRALAGQEHKLCRFIQRYLRTGDVLFTTWRDDGDEDHEAVGRASAQAAANVGALLREMPIWAWHGADSSDGLIPWQRARKVRLDSWSVARKRHAAHAYASQFQGDPQIGLEPVLDAFVMERLLQPFEVVFI